MNTGDEMLLGLGRKARVVRVNDNLDAVTAPQLVEVFLSAGTEGFQELVLDLSTVRFMDSAGIGAIVSVFRELRSSGVRLAVVGATGQPLDLIKMVGLDSVVELYAGLPAAARDVDARNFRAVEERHESLVVVKD